jgi:hypothetical protein
MVEWSLQVRMAWIPLLIVDGKARGFGVEAQAICKGTKA